MDACGKSICFASMGLTSVYLHLPRNMATCTYMYSLTERKKAMIIDVQKILKKEVEKFKQLSQSKVYQ